MKKAEGTRVLCVDDQADVLALLQRQLGGRFECHAAGSAAEALEMLQGAEPFPVIVVDYTMPDLSGAEVMKAVKRAWPDTIGVMLTASSELDVAVAALNDGNVYRFVRKPWKEDDIVNAVEDAASYYYLVLNERYLRDQLARANAELDEKVQDLDEANELLEYWVEFSPAVLYSLSQEEGELRPSYISKNFTRLSGYLRTAAIIDANFWTAHIAASARARYNDTLALLLSGERLHAVLEYPLEHKSGDTVLVLDSMRAIQDANGNTIEILGAWLDISARA